MSKTIELRTKTIQDMVNRGFSYQEIKDLLGLQEQNIHAPKPKQNSKKPVLDIILGNNDALKTDDLKTATSKKLIQFGRQINAARKQQNLTQEDLAKMLGLKDSATGTISRVENGRLHLSFPRMVLLARKMGLDLKISFELLKELPAKKHNYPAQRISTKTKQCPYCPGTFAARGLHQHILLAHNINGHKKRLTPILEPAPTTKTTDFISFS